MLIAGPPFNGKNIKLRRHQYFSCFDGAKDGQSRRSVINLPIFIAPGSQLLKCSLFIPEKVSPAKKCRLGRDTPYKTTRHAMGSIAN